MAQLIQPLLHSLSDLFVHFRKHLDGFLLHLRQCLAQMPTQVVDEVLIVFRIKVDLPQVARLLEVFVRDL